MVTDRNLNICSTHKQFSLGESFKDSKYLSLPFPDGELFLSGQYQPLGTRSLR